MCSGATQGPGKEVQYGHRVSWRIMWQQGQEGLEAGVVVQARHNEVWAGATKSESNGKI